MKLNKAFTVYRATNGLVIELPEDTDEHDYKTQQVFVFEEAQDEVKKFTEFLYMINEIVGPSTSRYSAERISIGVVPGDKYDDRGNREGSGAV